MLIVVDMYLSICMYVYILCIYACIQICIHIYININLIGPVRPPLSVPGNRELGKDRSCQAHRLKWTSDLHILHRNPIRVFLIHNIGFKQETCHPPKI